MATHKKRAIRKTNRPSKKASAKKPTPAFSFIKSKLTVNPEASFAQIRDAGAKKGLKVAPVLYGRVKALMGLVPMAKRGEGVKKRGAAPSRALGKRGPGRPRKTDISTGLLAEIQKMQRDRQDMKEALAQIRHLIDRVI